MRFSTPLLVMAALAGASAASAEPIMVLNAATPARAAMPASDCAAPAEAGADIECVLSLTPPQRGAEPAAPSRIVIRAQWAPKPCAPREAQVLDLSRPATRATAVPIVDQAGSGRACAS